MESQTSSLFQQYLPDVTSLSIDQRDRFVALTSADGRVALKDAFKNYRKILLNTTPEEVVNQELIRRHIQAGILAEAILGTTELKFQALQLINIIGSVDTTHLLKILTKVSTNDNLRNLSELTDVLTEEQLKLPEVQAAFVLPLVNAFKQGTQRIVSEMFSVKWLDTFIELVRSVNNLLKKQSCLLIQQKQHLIQLSRNALQHLGILRRDIITQLYLIVVTLNAEQHEPDNILAKVHYLHCKSIVYNTPVLSQLLRYTSIPQTETKYHLLYGLSYSLEKEFPTYSHKDEVFQRIVELYQVGRTATGIIEQMIRIIVKESATWRIDGYLARKFFVARCILKALDDYQLVNAQWPNILSEAIEYSGNLNTPFAIDCVELILRLLFRKCQQDPEVWLRMWIDDYLKFLLEGNRLTVKGIVEFINPIICKISKRPVLLRRLLEVDEIKQHSEENIELGIISLLQCYRENGLIEPRESGVYEYKDEPEINIPANKLETLLQSNNCSIALKSFEFITVSQKPSEVVNSFEYKLLIGFYKLATVTSNTDYRRSYVTATKKFFQRLRTIYQKELSPPVKKTKPIRLFDEFQKFMMDLLEHCFACLYPDMPFELANPALEIILNALNHFGVYDYEVRKGTIIKGNSLLRYLGVFSEPNFGVLISCLQSSFENIRTLGYNILRQFPSDFQFDSEQLWYECLSMTNSLVIRQFESGCRLICFLFERYRLKTPVQKVHDLPELDLYEYLLQLMQQRYEIFSKDFANQTAGYYKNLVHGLCTCFAYLFDQLSKNIKTSPQIYSIHANTIKQFINKLFELLIQIISFAVEVSCANVSTVVLDSSQSKLATLPEKLKVDCRGHFIQQDKKQFLGNVEKMLSGSTLMTSVDEEEGSMENTLVVSFYLLTRESGLLFQSIATLAEADNQQLYLSQNILTDVIYSFFYALVNLKHMGSVDRIARGLQKMSKALYKQENQSLATLPEVLLKKLLQLLEESKFTNILRRSAGIPYAFTCLLKSEALRRRHLVESTVNKLFYFAKNESSGHKDLRVHSLNILKRLFQDADLRFQLDPFVSEAFVLSIKGFGTEDWGVRNSSLMLFSSLSLRTLGPKPQLNLMQFFQKCPSLIDYFLEELISYIRVKSMYPPLYPIALLLSRLVPFEQVALTVQDTHEKNSKLLRREELNKFIPLLIEAGNTPNYMGRVIIGKALLPFLQLNQILDFCTPVITNIKLGNSNKLHSQLLIVYHLMSSLHQIQQTSLEKSPENNQKLSDKDIIFFRELNGKIVLIEKMNCPLVQEMLVKVAHLFLEKRSLLLERLLTAVYQQFVNWFQGYAQRFITNNVYQLPYFRFKQDLGHSVFRMEVLKLALGLSNRLIHSSKSMALFEEFFSFVENKCSETGYWRKIDNEVVMVYLHELNKVLKINKKTTTQPVCQRLIKQLTKIAFGGDITSAILAEILLILKRLKVIITEDQIKCLLAQSKTTHQPLKIAIFKLLCCQKCDLRSMTDEFSRPDQLIHFRESAAKSIRHFDETLLPTYIRLLQDEDSQIRKFTAERLSTILGLPHFNEAKMADLLFDRVTNNQVKTIIDDGDLQTKSKNNEEMRIFSFDKANKFRSDVSNILCLLERKRPIEAMKEGFLLKQQPNIDTYSKRIFLRNEYKFQAILRKIAHLIIVQGKLEQASVCVHNLEPMLKRFVRHLLHHK